MLVAEKWVDSVIDVKRLSERLLVLRMAVGNIVLNVVCVYAPQVGRTKEEKQEFLTVLGDVLHRISDNHSSSSFTFNVCVFRACACQTVLVCV